MVELMSISHKLRALLEKEGVEFNILEHQPAYTALEIAGAQHVPGRQVIKSVIVKVDGRFVMCVLPAIHYLDLEKLKTALSAKQVELATEEDIARLFPDDEVGGEPPFGNLYGLPIIVDKILEEDNDIVFNAGSHTEMIQMKFSDYQRLVKSRIAEIGVHI